SGLACKLMTHRRLLGRIAGCLHAAKRCRHMYELGPPGVVLRASISILVTGVALAGSIGSAAAQYPPPQPPPLGYPPPAPYSYPVDPPRYLGAYPYGDAEVPYRRPGRYPPDSEPPESYPPPTSYSYRGGPRYPVYPYSGSPPSQDHGTVVAALPPEYQ